MVSVAPVLPWDLGKKWKSDFWFLFLETFKTDWMLIFDSNYGVKNTCMPTGLGTYIEKSGHLSKIKEEYWLKYCFPNTVYFEDEFYNIVN